MSPEPGGVLLPGYRAVERLARGRRLDTWHAHDEARDVACIVKIVREDRRAEPDVVAALLEEGRVLTTLVHPHLVRGWEVVDDPPAVVMEVLRGATLAAVVEDGPLDLADLALLGGQLCSVLGYLHRHDRLHLDVKPANVVVEHGKAVLIDLSLVAPPGVGRRGAGTRGYLAPEQDRGTALGPAADVWGLGVTLLECLTGELAHGSDPDWRARHAWLARLRSRAPRDPRGLGLPADLPDAVRRVLLACVDPDPAARPRLVDVRDELRAAAGLTG